MGSVPTQKNRKHGLDPSRVPGCRLSTGLCIRYDLFTRVSIHSPRQSLPWYTNVVLQPRRNIQRWCICHVHLDPDVCRCGSDPLCRHRIILADCGNPMNPSTLTVLPTIAREIALC